MIQHLQDAGIRVPCGFATTAEAYWAFLDQNELRAPITDKLAQLEQGETSLDKTGDTICRLIGKGEFPPELFEAIRSAYVALKSTSAGPEN